MMYFHVPLAALCIHSVGCGNVPERVSGVERDRVNFSLLVKDSLSHAIF